MGKVRLELNSLTARHTLNWLDSPEADFHVELHGLNAETIRV